MRDWRGQRVTVWGLGRFGGGLGITRWLLARGAEVHIVDQAGRDALAAPLAELAGQPVHLHLGGQEASDFPDCDALVVNPAVPERHPRLVEARAAGVHLTTEMNEFLLRCPARVIGVTGTVGKSTTTAMLAAVLEAQVDSRVWVGGNLGRSLLADLPRIRAEDYVVLELSSFQLQRTAWIRWSPHVAVLTNLAPNHLDWHGTFAAYAAAKLNIVRYQDPQRDRIVTLDDPQWCDAFMQMFGDLAGIWRYGVDDGGTIAARCQTNSAVESPDAFAAWPDVTLGVPGRHNRLNAAAALTAVRALDLGRPVDPAPLATFAGLPDRLERIGVFDEVTYFNDSKASTPEAALTALHAFDQPLLVIVGGFDKGVSLEAFARQVAERARVAACIGATGPGLAAAIRTAGGQAEECGTLEQAVAHCHGAARPGDVVLLSPACASWDQFEDYRARGSRFRALVTGTP